MKQRLFTTIFNIAQPSFHATRKENYKTLVSQMDVLDPEKIKHKNSRFGEDDMKSSWCAVKCLFQGHNRMVFVGFEPRSYQSQSQCLNHSTNLPTVVPGNTDSD